MTDLARHEHDHEELLRRRSIMAVVGALLLLVICAPMWLVYRASTSTAAFADSEVLDKNRLGAAILDIEIGDGAVTFEASNLAPGDIVSGQLELKNAGTLPLLYEISGNSDGDPLADWLRFELWISSTTCDISDPTDRLAQDVVFDPRATSFDDISASESSAIARGSLGVGQRRIVCMGARLVLEAPNDVQGRRSEIDIIVDAVHDIETDLAEAAR